MKRFTAALILVLLLINTCLIYAAPEGEESSAEYLYSLGLFKGIDTQDGKPVFALDSTLTREQAIVMLIRLLGKEQEAIACDFPADFTDVPQWVRPYVGYAQVTGLTLGMGDGTFGGALSVTGTQFLTFVLRALGYSTPIDFRWEDACVFADSVGLNGSQYSETAALTRGQAAVICAGALEVQTREAVALLTQIQNSGKVNLNPQSYNLGSFSGKGGSSGTTGYVVINNQTNTLVSPTTLLNQPVSTKAVADNSVQVLIVHTHASESFTPTDGLEYKTVSKLHTLDSQRNMLRIGEITADILNSRGIGTVQITDIVDYPNYNNSYDRMEVLIKQALVKYPNVKLVIDMHRDSYAKDGKQYKTNVTVNGRSACQMMFVSGSLNNPDWQENLSLQVKIHNELENRYPGLMRPIIFRERDYNHDLTPGSMLVEVGTDGNSLSEAMYSAYLFADTLADFLLD